MSKRWILGPLMLVALQPGLPVQADPEILLPEVTRLGGNDSRRDTRSLFRNPRGLAVDQDENVYIADSGSHSIRRVSPDGQVSTFAGADYNAKSPAGYRDGPGQEARFSSPAAIAFDPFGTLYVADSQNKCIRIIDTKGLVSTFARGPLRAEFQKRDVATWLDAPIALTFDRAGHLYVHDQRGSLLHFTREVRPSLLAGPVSSLEPLLALMPQQQKHQSGELDATEARRYKRAVIVANQEVEAGPYEPAGWMARWRLVSGLAADDRGELLVAEPTHQVARFSRDGRFTVVAGNGEPGNSDGRGVEGTLWSPLAIQRAANGMLFVAESSAVRLVTPDGAISTLVRARMGPSSKDPLALLELPTSISAMALSPAGNLYVCSADSLYRIAIPPALSRRHAAWMAQNASLPPVSWPKATHIPLSWLSVTAARFSKPLPANSGLIIGWEKPQGGGNSYRYASYLTETGLTAPGNSPSAAVQGTPVVTIEPANPRSGPVPAGELTLTGPGGAVVKAHLPGFHPEHERFWADEKGRRFTRFYVATDGSTFYDRKLTRLARQARGEKGRR